ncbi:MAG: hypothetical protein MUF00_13605 [Gemmatimonadaceae bacterium]|nr:hypothetical protein [Gemmatimonadaceae bacterium]
MIDISREEEIRNPKDVRRHLVLLGAGASCAATPHGDAKGRRLPVMNNFVETVGVGSLLDKAGIDWAKRNFEDVYSELAASGGQHEVKEELERRVESYFSGLVLPSQPTVYDHLVLSLRKKDVIATFNWDPFLIQAYRRSRHVTDSLPMLLFLHGCVAHGFCAKDDVSGLRGARCSRCGGAFTPDRLLFPISQKDYSTAPSVASAWEKVRQGLEESLMFTIFGYGAPTSDRDAVALLQRAWGSASSRQLEQIEIIDIRSEEELANTWSGFIHTHHYDVFRSFHDSFIANHPRRSIEAFGNQYLDARFIEENPAPLNGTLDELHSWFTPLVQAERAAGL